VGWQAVRVHKLGANTWIWTSPLTDAWLAEFAPRIRAWGFDVIELPIENLDDWQPERTRDVLQHLGLEATTCLVMPPERDLVSDNARQVADTQAYLIGCLDAAAAIGASVVAGPAYAPVGRTWLLQADERERTVDRLVDALQPVVAHAEDAGVGLGIEPLNRYETSLINTVAQALEIVERLDSPACGVALDTFHLNIEEKDPVAAIRAAGSRIAHVQVCGNDRGAPGSDHIDWAGTLEALGEAGYAGPLCIESFSAGNRSLARAASIWRPLERSQDAIATDGLAFLRGLMASQAQGSKRAL
jgi:D-psicose/D-tagatose/L-ribulose 3-epimerase